MPRNKTSRNLKDISSVFLSSIQSASKDIEDVVCDLDQLRHTLDEIRDNEEKFGSHAAIRTTLERCMKYVASLNSIAESLNARLASMSPFIRKRAAFVAVMRTGKIKQLKEKLQDAKLTLLMAQTSSALYVTPCMLL